MAQPVPFLELTDVVLIHIFVYSRNTYNRIIRMDQFGHLSLSVVFASVGIAQLLIENIYPFICKLIYV